MLAVCHVRRLTSLCKGLQYSKAEVTESETPSVCFELWSDGAYAAHIRFMNRRERIMRSASPARVRMLALPPTTQPTLPLLSTIARLLSSDRSFAARVSDLFVLLREAVVFHDGRLVCWLQSAHAGGMREQFYTPNGWPDAWNDELTRQVVERGTAVRLTRPMGRLRKGDRADLPGEVADYGGPVLGDG